MPAPVRLVFLGGLGEIGRNCFCLELGGRILVVDCGLMFPDADMPGVDLVLPDFTYLRDNADRVEGVVLTHGHEDHVGGLAYLLRDVSAPIFGSALCLGLARNRIEEAGLLGRTELVTVRDGDRIDIGPFDVEFVPIAHSVPHAFATAFRTPAGTILHTGDFKIDLTPFDGRQTDLARLGQIAGEGVTLLLSDSTNAEKPGFTPSETTVGPVIHDILRNHPDRRVIVAAFSSHLHRVAQVVQAARACGRKVAFVGRSMLQNTALARSLGMLDLPESEVVDIEEVARMAPGSVCVVGTGSQGEPMSALSLMAAQEHKHLKIGPDDVVVISAHAIPGNEHNVDRVIDSLHRAGADVVHDKTAPVHVSGHAAQEELKFMLALVQPRWFVPVHGEFRHLVHHARLAHAVGVPEERVLLCTDGDVVTIDAGELEVARRAVPAGYQYVDGVLDDISVGVLRDRKSLAAEGVVVVIVTVDAASGDLVTGPEIVTRGWVHEAEAADLLDEARAEVRAAIARAAADGATDPEAVRRHARRALGRFINARTRRRPAIIPVVLEV
ncbi:MAG: ribonuclease J [Actinobacteria bacterium]|nr:ribonuclease J [Actinomycetota bacterium]